MPTPTGPEKRLFAAGFKKTTPWGTAAALGAGYGILITDDGGLGRKHPYYPIKEHDLAFVSEGTLGPDDPVDFAPAFAMRYDPGALGTMIAMLFGTAGAPTLVASPAYKHVFQWATTTWGLFGTFAIERPNKIWEVASCKPTGLDFSLGDGVLKGSIKMRGNRLIDNSAVNTLTQMDALTYVDRTNIVRFTQGTVKLNAQSGVDVAGTTALTVNDISISIERPSDALVTFGNSYIVQPAQGEYPKATIKLNFPRFDSLNEAYFSTFTAQATQKLLLQFIGTLITGTTYYDLKLYFPRLRITEFDAPDNEVVPTSITLEAEQATAASTGMSYLLPYAELINLQTTDYLA